MNKLIIVSVIVLVLIGGVYYIVTQNNSNSLSGTTPFNPTISQSSDTANDVIATDTSSLDQQSSYDNSDDAVLNDAISSL